MWLNFNPRAPYGARLSAAYPVPWNKYISIHAPHTGRDDSLDDDMEVVLYFNPRAPYGARLLLPILSILIMPFQSTRPIRGATAKMHNLCSAFLQ